MYEDGDHEAERKLLLDYLNSTKPRDYEEAPIFLSEIMETWVFAGQHNDDNVMSAVPAIVALLLRILGQTLEMVPYGLGICRTLLQKRQLELIARNLSADKGKEFVISPMLRLLREMICFDGGAVAMPIFRARSFTFRSLGRNMSIKYLGKGQEERKRPSGRTNAVRFFLSALKFLNQEAKRELLSQKDVTSALIRTIKDDPPYLVIDILTALKAHVLLDTKLPRDVKGRVLNANTLSRIAPLYTYKQEDPEAEGRESVAEIAHDFLQFSCTVPSAGILRPQSGFYPAGTEQEAESLVESGRADGLGLENIVWMDQFRQETTVRNVVLSDFIQNLRPWSNVKQAELLISIFTAAPELAADYFFKKQGFTFEPKLSATWIGYAALLFGTLTIDIPKYFGHPGGYSPFPPPTSVVMDNIMPPPLNPKALTRCFSQKSNLISFFATRLLVAAVEKLDRVVRLYRDPCHSNKELWGEAARRLVDEFCQRSLSIKDILASYRSIPERDVLHREAASRLVRLYYEVIPQIALIAKFDVSPSLVVAIERLDKRELGDTRDQNLGLIELEHLLVIARCSPGMRWFANLGGLALSPFTTLLRLTVDTWQGLSSDKILDVLNFIAREQQLVVSSPEQSGLAPIIQSFRLLKDAGKTESIAEIWAFLDQCMSRCATRPIKYLDMTGSLLEEEVQTDGAPMQGSIISPLTMAILEQLPSTVGTGDNKALPTLAEFLSHFVGFSKLAGGDAALLDCVFRRLRVCFPESLQARMQVAVPDAPGPAPTSRPMDSDTPMLDGTPRTLNSTHEEGSSTDAKSIDELFASPVGLELDNSALTRWSTKTVDELIDEGYAAKLISLLASEHTSIRKEALTNILKMAVRIRESDYDEKDQCWLLLAELAESAKGQVDGTPIPTPIVAFTCRALEVLRDPLHDLYPKVNTFLNRGPVWNLDRLPLVYEIVQEEPSVDGSYYLSISWLVAYLLDSLRTPADLALFHKKRMFERLLSLASNPYMRAPLKTQFLRILYQTTCIEGGSTTLTTRFGIIGWLESQKASSSGEDAWIYEALIKRVWETADQERILSWSKGGIRDVVDA